MGRWLAVTMMVVAGLAWSDRARAETFRWAAQGDAATLDPHGLAEGFTLGFLGNVYEGLVRRAGDLALESALATSWEQTEPTVWRFELRPDVTFQDGTPFTETLVNTYVSPVVVCAVSYNNNSTPVVTRVANVTSTSFDVRLLRNRSICSS